MNDDARRCVCGERWGQHRERCPYPEYAADKTSVTAWITVLVDQAKADLAAIERQKEGQHG